MTPAAIHPGWLGAHGLIRPDDAEKAKIRMIAPEVSIFELPWANIQVLSNRFEVVVKDPTDFEAGRDLVASIFRLVDGWPLGALGINHHFSWVMSDPNPLDSVAQVPLGALLNSEIASTQLVRRQIS